MDKGTVTSTTRSRRSLLLAGAGAAAGAAVAALGAPAAALANNGDTWHVGDNLSGSAATTLDITGAGGFQATTDYSAATALTGIHNNVSGGTGVLGISAGAGSGVQGLAQDGYGVYAAATGGTGVYGGSVSGTGVRGSAASGTGVSATSTTGYALRASGKVDFNRAGRVTIAKGASSIKVAVPGGVTTSTLGFANLRLHNSGVYVTAVIPEPSTGKLWIRLSKAVPAATSVAWFAVR